MNQSNMNEAVVPVPGKPRGKFVLTRKGFAELARRGLVRCRACEFWESKECENPKLNRDVQDYVTEDDGIAHDISQEIHLQFGPDFGCIHFQPKYWGDYEQDESNRGGDRGPEDAREE